jgi:hypothetical protein
MFQHETMPLLCVLCVWLIPNGMNNTGCMAFSTELYCLRQNNSATSPRYFRIISIMLYCLRQIIPQRIIANIFLGHNIGTNGVNGNHIESRQGLKLGRNIPPTMTAHSVRNVPTRNDAAVLCLLRLWLLLNYEMFYAEQR